MRKLIRDIIFSSAELQNVLQLHIVPCGALLPGGNLQKHEVWLPLKKIKKCQGHLTAKNKDLSLAELLKLL